MSAASPEPHVDEAPLRFALPGGGALFTTRADGNLSTLRGEQPEHGRRERDRLCSRLGLRWLCASRQVHGATVLRIRAEDGSGGEALAVDADGHATSLAGVGTMVLVADCLPVLLAAPRAVAALHAGWRGLAAGVLEEGVRAVRELGGDGEIAAFVGPGAGPCCYEVGDEVRTAFGHRPLDGELRELPPRALARGHRTRTIDLPALAAARLADAGVSDVTCCGICTICDARLYSHRREGPRAGRQAGVVWLGSAVDGNG